METGKDGLTTFPIRVICVIRGKKIFAERDDVGR
jgi:hypothetical protein